MSPEPDHRCGECNGEAQLAAALAPFGWTCTDDFWRRYYSDPWVFNLANAVEYLTRLSATEGRYGDPADEVSLGSEIFGEVTWE